MTNNLEKITRAVLDFSMNQCTHFCENPRLNHKKDVHKVIRFLKSTKLNIMIFTPDQNKSIECYVDANFTGGWNSIDSDNPANVLSRSKYVSMYFGCPLV